MRPSRPHRDGYTLLELMIVIVIIAVVSALAVPGIVNSMRENRTFQGAAEVARMFRQARLEAVSRGSAAAIRFDRGVPQGRLRMYRSPVSSCSLTNWTAAGGTGPTDGRFFTEVDFSQAPYQNTSSNDVRINYCRTLSADKQTCTAGPAITWICYTPAGRVYWRDGDGGAFNAAPTAAITGGWTFRVERREAGTQLGVYRVVFVPYGGGTARVQQ